MKTLPRLTVDAKRSIAEKMQNQSSTDEAIMAEYGQIYNLDSATLQEIRKSIERSNSTTDIKSPQALSDAMIATPTMVDEVNVVGGNIAKMTSVGEIESRAFGTKIPGGDENITNKTQIGIGSVTKLFTAVALFNIIDKEKQGVANNTISADQENFKDGLDTKLSNFMDKLSAKYPECQYLQEIQKMPNYKDISLRNLLEHSAGLHGRDDFGLAVKQLQGAPMPNPENILDQHTQESEKFGKYKYNNLGYELLGMVMSVASSKSYDEVLKDNVIDKYQLKDTSLKTQPSDDVAQGRLRISKFEYNGQIFPDQYMGFTDNGNSVFAGGLMSTGEDMAKFIQKTFAGDSFQSEYMKGEIDKMKAGQGGVARESGGQCVNGFNFKDGVLSHQGDNADSKAGAYFDISKGEASAFAFNGENLSVMIAKEALELQKEKGEIARDAKIDDKIISEKIRELDAKGFDFKKLNGLIENGGKITDIAKQVEEAPRQASSKAQASLLETILSKGMESPRR